MDLLRRWLPGPDIAVFHTFRAPPYGGGNQFLLGLIKELKRKGLDARASSGIGRRTRACLFNSFNFESEDLVPASFTRCRKVHRVDGPIGLYRGTDDEVDRKIWSFNQTFADATVFQSNYSLKAHEALGLDFRSPVVIPNAVDPEIFHAKGGLPRDPRRKVRLISTSWSDNPAKGAATYKWLEERLDWTRFEYTFVGRSPITFDRIRTLPPVDSATLAGILRQHDVYVTASRNDACSNALLEALACGLPALAVRSGGNPELVGQGGALFAGTEDLVERLDEVVSDYERRRESIRLVSLSEVADRYIDVLFPPALGGTKGLLHR